MLKKLFYLTPGVFVSILILSGCSNDERKSENINLYFQEASTAYQNGDFDKAVYYYKEFLSSDTSKSEASIQYTNLQLARIAYSKNSYNEAINYAQKVNNSELFVRSNWQKEETFFDHTMKGMFTNKETDKINSFGYSLKNNALTIIGTCYLKKRDFENAIKSFKYINPDSEGYFYLALSYGLKGDLENERRFYKLNSKNGNIGLIETKEWLNNSSISK
jgi:lipoprotein NlpI